MANCAPLNGNSAMSSLANSPPLNRRRLFEKFRKAFRQDFEFIDVRHDLNNNLLTEDECRQIGEEPDTDKQLERLFFLLTYNEKKSIRKFVELIRNSYYWLSAQIEAYLEKPQAEDPDKYEVCINRSWTPNKRNVFVHRCDLVSDLLFFR